MGFSVSGATAVILIGLLIGISIGYPAIMGGTFDIVDAKDVQSDRAIAYAESDVVIQDATFADESVVVVVENTGTRTLAVDKTDLLIDGIYVTDVESEIIGYGHSAIWQPGEELELTVEQEGSPAHVKIVAETGVADRTEVNSE